MWLELDVNAQINVILPSSPMRSIEIGSGCLTICIIISLDATLIASFFLESHALVCSVTGSGGFIGCDCLVKGRGTVQVQHHCALSLC